MKKYTYPISVGALVLLSLVVITKSLLEHENVEAGGDSGAQLEGRRFFENETFGGNGRTCLTCHSRETGTISAEDARERFKQDPKDPLFLHDGSDDGLGHGVTRILNDATIRVELPLPPNVTLADDPDARFVVVNRGIPSTLNTPALDSVLMYDGRAPNLMLQAEDAILGHAQAGFADPDKVAAIAQFERSSIFFTSGELRRFARGGPNPVLPEGRTPSEKRGRRFFEDVPIGVDNSGVCAVCHSGPMLNHTNRFIPAPVPAGTRFESAFVSQLNKARNPVHEFVFKNPDGSRKIVQSPDPGRALITGDPKDINNFKIPTLWGARETAPYFHDNSAKTLEDVATQYKEFFEIVTDPDGPGGADPKVILSEQDKADMVAFMKLLR